MVEQGDNIGTRLAEALADAGLSQSDLARRLAGPQASRSRVDARRRLVLKWLSNRHRPSCAYADELATIFGRPRDFFALPAPPDARIAGTDLELISYAEESALGAVERPSTDLVLPLEGAALAALTPRFNPARILIDRVDELEPGLKLCAETTFRRDTWGLGYWYRGADFVAGILQIEAMAQASALMLLAVPAHRDRMVLAGGFEHVRFRHPLKLDETLVIRCQLQRATGPISRVEAVARRGDDLVARIEAILVVR